MGRCIDRESAQHTLTLIPHTQSPKNPQRYLLTIHTFVLIILISEQRVLSIYPDSAKERTAAKPDMCKLTELQHNIHSITKDGEHIARFLTETMRGETPGVKVCHRMEAAKHLIKYGFTDADCDNIPPLPQDESETCVQSPLSPGERVRVRGKEISEAISHLDILNYQIAHLIRHETAEGHTLVNFLVDIMTGKDRPFTPRKFRIKPADRMAATRELLRRGFGDLGSRRRLSDTTDEANAYDTLHTDLARRMREYSERGTDTIRFLLEVMSDPDPDLEFTIHHRMSAAQELLRRGWDTNYDNIKPKHLQAYWQDKESPRLSIGQKKTQAGLSTSIDDYDQYDRHRLQSHSQRDQRRRRPRRQLKASSLPRDRPIFSPFLRKQESRRPRSRQSCHKAPSPSGRGLG